jgi:hypothetical protein
MCTPWLDSVYAATPLVVLNNFWKYLFVKIVARRDLSTFLQDTDYDILEAIKESKTVNEMLRAERQDESV